MSEEKNELFDEVDVKLMMAHTGTTREIAIHFLKKNPGDLIGAILDIQKDQESVEVKEPDCT